MPTTTTHPNRDPVKWSPMTRRQFLMAGVSIGCATACATLLTACKDSQVTPKHMPASPPQPSSGRTTGPHYSTNFEGTENPLSEGGVWTCGGVVGVDWTNPRKSNGIAHGTQTPHIEIPYDDSIASLSGFGPDVVSQCTLHLDSGNRGEHEVELLFRFLIEPHWARGYELNWLDNGNIYFQTWNGALNDFGNKGKPLFGPINVTPHHGDVLKAQLKEAMLTVWVNDGLIHQYDTAHDAMRWSDGNPGIGFYTDLTRGDPSAPSTFGMSSFAAHSA